MKKCPFCAEEVQDAAIKCRHCGADLSQKSVPKIASKSPVPAEPFWKNPFMQLLLWFSYLTIYLCFLVATPYFAAFLLLFPIWWFGFGKKNESTRDRLRDWRNHRVRVGLTIAAFIFSALVQSSVASSIERKQMIDAYPVPEIVVTSPTDDQGSLQEYALSLQTKNTERVDINGQQSSPNDQGLVTTMIPLVKPSTTISITAKNAYKSSNSSIVITRNLTAEEGAVKAQDIAEHISRAKEQLSDARTEIGTLKASASPVGIDAIRDELSQLGSLWLTINVYGDEDDVSVKSLASSTTKELQSLQRTRFPMYRRNFASQASDMLWEHDVDVRVAGNGNSILILTGHYFASNGNIKAIQTTISDTAREMRFDQVRYEWYQGSDYTYFNLESPNDADPI